MARIEGWLSQRKGSKDTYDMIMTLACVLNRSCTHLSIHDVAIWVVHASKWVFVDCLVASDVQVSRFDWFTSIKVVRRSPIIIAQRHVNDQTSNVIDGLHTTDKVSILAIDENHWEYDDCSSNDDYRVYLCENGVRGIDGVTTLMGEKGKQWKYFWNNIGVRS